MPQTHIIWRCLFHLVSVLGLVVIVVFLAVQMQSSYDLPLAAYFVVGLAYLGIVWLTIIVHELGHALAAWLVGFRIEMIVFGPIKLMLINGRYRWRGVTQAYAPGYIVATPLGEHRLFSRYALYILAGPLFSLFFAIVAGLIFWSYFDELDASNSINGIRHRSGAPVYFFFAAGFACLINLYVFLLSIIPMNAAGGRPNDAAILLWFRQQYKQCTLRDLKIASFSYMCNEGVRPNQWNRAEMMLCLGAMQSGTISDLHTYLLGYYHFLDSGSIQVAEQLLEKALECHEKHSAKARASVLLESVYFQAIYHSNSANAWEVLKKCEGDTAVEQPTRLRAETAAYYVDRKYELAISKAEEALRLLKHSKDRGGALAEADWINDIIARCKKAMAAV